MSRRRAGGAHSWLARHLSRDPDDTASRRSACLPCGALLLTFALEFLQTYLMQWTGQKIMFDMRSADLPSPAADARRLLRPQPVGRLVTRVTSDVDALNEMFTSGVLAIFENVFVLLFIVMIMLWMSWPLALLTLRVLPVDSVRHAASSASHVRDSYRRMRAAIARSTPITQEHVSRHERGAAVQPRDSAPTTTSTRSTRSISDAWTDAIFAYALYYPVVELLSSIAIAAGDLARRHAAFCMRYRLHRRHASTLGVLIAFMQYAQRFFRPIQDLSEKYNILQAAMAASERVFKLLDTTPEHRLAERSRAGDEHWADRPRSSSAMSGSPISS